MDGNSENTITKAFNEAISANEGKRNVFIDLHQFAHWLDDSGLPEPQKHVVLEEFWKIIVGFVDLGFGVHPLQECCGQEPENNAEPDNPPS